MPSFVGERSDNEARYKAQPNLTKSRCSDVRKSVPTRNNRLVQKGEKNERLVQVPSKNGRLVQSAQAVT